MSATDKAYKNARRFRRHLSLPEKLLWVRLRGASPRCRRQHPIGQYVLDFYCPAASLAIEVDGMAHDMGDRPRRDEVRTAWLKESGIEMLRIPAKQVLDDPDAVAEAIIAYCADLANPSTTASGGGPPPHR
jgi:very-short-patch-repair endonuclease